MASSVFQGARVGAGTQVRRVLTEWRRGKTAAETRGIAVARKILWRQSQQAGGWIGCGM